MFTMLMILETEVPAWDCKNVAWLEIKNGYTKMKERSGEEEGCLQSREGIYIYTLLILLIIMMVVRIIMKIIIS